ncbi:phage_term_2, phage terminase, large subunit, PBSX family [uncultured Caudovirales phage]|uniref:Phage_term_2, phage terminase, large subunit, PBSX family n=1 Tax=uncultured Caudovirales phage TaxID=2100421 RepID=A0A6J7X5C8_9CAUD|nr:phage_term_2, phage terminase, large subunit, PBSX family [uncultured Caudovirales phage]
MFKRTTAINKILKGLSAHKTLVIQGGTYAGKTYGIMAVLIDYAARHPNERITVTAETLPAVKSGALRQFVEIMTKTGRFVHSRLKASSKESSGITYTFSNGTYVEFRSFDSVGKAKAAGKRDVLFINEANHTNYEIMRALMDRAEKKVLIDFNPDTEFWAHTEVLPSPGSGFLLLKYTDNEGCPDEIVKLLEYRRTLAATSEYWANYCRVYIDGEIGILQNALISNWSIVDAIPEGAKLIGHGLDFGFNPDPAACVTVYEYQGARYAHENFYRQNMNTIDYANELKKLSRDAMILADHNKMLIFELSSDHKLKIAKAYKPPGSIEAGIADLNKKPLYVTASSVNLIRELRGYTTDESGNIRGDDHAIDATRYAISRRQSSGGFTA